MKKQSSIPDQIWLFFSSVKLTVYTLTLLATTSIIGTVVLQNGSPMQYVRLYGKGMANLIRVLGIDDMYHTGWFLGLLVLLCINIIVCSVERLSRTWKIIFPGKIKVNPDRFNKSKVRQSFVIQKPTSELAGICQNFFSRKVGRVIQMDSGEQVRFYSEKGRWTRIGVYVVHASVILLLVGALIGSVFGFKANLRLDEGAGVDTVVQSQSRIPIQLDFTIRCNEFEVKFYDTGAPEEFRSNLTILENGKESFTKDIRVNHPLRYKGINIFQSSYGMAPPDSAVFSIVNNRTKQEVVQKIKKGQSIELPGGQGSFLFQGFLPHFEFKGHDLGEAFFGRVSLKEEKPIQIGLPTQFPTFDKMRKGRFSFVVKSFDKRYYTGLQVTKDPGVWSVYGGFILMILGCWVTFFMAHDAYFIVIEPQDGDSSRIVMAGKTNRNPRGMALKLEKLAQHLQKQIFKENTHDHQ